MFTLSTSHTNIMRCFFSLCFGFQTELLSTLFHTHFCWRENEKKQIIYFRLAFPRLEFIIAMELFNVLDKIYWMFVHRIPCIAQSQSSIVYTAKCNQINDSVKSIECVTPPHLISVSRLLKDMTSDCLDKHT